MTDKEARDFVRIQSVAPDDIIINNKPWKLEGTYLTNKEALGSSEFLDSFRIFRYSNGYALYERRLY